MVGMAGFPMTIASVRSQIVSAIRVVMQLQRLSDGKRRVVSISEITGLEGDVAQMQEIFKFVRTGTGDNGEVLGSYRATGVRPKFLADLAAAGVNLPGAYFDPTNPL
jgi:pilus assembly protein CpaF